MDSATPERSAPVITAADRLADLATSWAGASRVFQRHGLDFCCGGGRTIAAACAQKGVDAAAVLTDLAMELRPLPEDQRFAELPISHLLSHLVDHYHRGHRGELPRLLAMARKVEAVHGQKLDCPRGLADALAELGDALEAHMRREEEHLFPMLLAGHGTEGMAERVALEHEHDEHGARLHRVRALAHDFVPPPAACGTWRALYLGLSEFERAVLQHVALENHVLFPAVGVAPDGGSPVSGSPRPGT